MAGDWIKMRTDLYRDPKVCVIADILANADGELGRYVNQHCQRDITVTRNVMRNVTVGALVSVWGVFRHRGKCVGDDLVVAGVTLAVIDDVSDLPGFGKAMASVGWAIEDDRGVVFPHFFEVYNVDPAADVKAKNAERQKRFRDRHKSNGSNVTVTPKRNAREEKRREEEKDEEAIASSSPPPETKSSKTKASGPHAEAIDSFCSSWKAKYRDNYFFAKGKDGDAVRWMLEQLGGDLARWKQAVAAYLADSDPFVVKDRHGLAVMRSQLRRYTVQARASPTVTDEQRAAKVLAERAKRERENANNVSGLKTFKQNFGMLPGVNGADEPH